MRPTVLVLGGGIIGLSCAYEAAQRGYRVTVVEQGEMGGQASGAAAGMLAPYYENSEGPDDFFRFCLDSFRRYPAWIEAIETLTGFSVGWTRSGSLHMALHEADWLPLQSRMAWQSVFGAGLEWVSDTVLRKLEPTLTETALGALYCPFESHVQAPKLVSALLEACSRLGVNLISHAGEMRSFEAGDSGILVEMHGAGRQQADLGVCATGAWTAELAMQLGLHLPVHPIRGQICAYESLAEQVNHMVYASQAYWVRKPDGSLVCGASEDVAGFDRTVTERGIGRLVRAGERMLPFLADCAPNRRWAGLRPATLDGRPLIGPVPALPNVYLAAGHYRNGILLSPATAAAFGAWLDDGSSYTDSRLAAFAPGRFSDDAVRRVGR